MGKLNINIGLMPGNISGYPDKMFERISPERLFGRHINIPGQQILLIFSQVVNRIIRKVSLKSLPQEADIIVYAGFLPVEGFSIYQDLFQVPML